MSWRDARRAGENVKVFYVGNDFNTPPGVDVAQDHSGQRWVLSNGARLPLTLETWIVLEEHGPSLFKELPAGIEVLPEAPAAVITRPYTDTPLMKITGPFQIGTLRGTVLRFARGEGLPVHVHLERNHISVVAKGRFECHGRPAIEGQIIEAGEFLDWIVGEAHGFIGLDEDNVMVQVNKAP